MQSVLSTLERLGKDDVTALLFELQFLKAEVGFIILQHMVNIAFACNICNIVLDICSLFFTTNTVKSLLTFLNFPKYKDNM
jgi:hypothetical protein